MLKFHVMLKNNFIQNIEVLWLLLLSFNIICFNKSSYDGGNYYLINMVKIVLFNYWKSM